MSQSRVTRRKYASFRSALVLVAIVASFWIFWPSISSGVADIFRTLDELGEEETTLAKNQIAGFFTYAEGDTAASPVAKREYLELNANGIVWHFTDWYINTPTGEKQKLTRVATGYIRPFSYSSENEFYLCEMRTLRQVYMANSDTCYGASQVDETWVVKRTAGSDKLVVNWREYQLYKGELTEFFPDGNALDVVNKFGLTMCPAASDMPFFGKGLLANGIESVPFFSRAQSVEAMIRDYYKPLVLDEIAWRQYGLYDPKTVPDEMAVRLTIGVDGAVKDLRHKTGKMDTRRFDELAENDIRTWRFSPVVDRDEDQVLDLVVKVK